MVFFYFRYFFQAGAVCMKQPLLIFGMAQINTELQNICSPNLHLFFSEFLFYYGNNVINHPFEPIFITALSHDADKRFRA